MQDVASEVFTPKPPYSERSNLPTNIEQAYGWIACLKEYIEDQGLDARIYTGQDWEAIKQHIDQGHALIANLYLKGSITHNHAWVVRGYRENGPLKLVIYNDPHDNPDTFDPITYDLDHDGLPGRSKVYREFHDEYWKSIIPDTDCVIIAVSVKGSAQGGPNIPNWQGTAGRNLGAFLYHSTRLTDKILEQDFIGAFFESAMVFIGSIGSGFGGIQIVGQILQAWAETVVEYCDEQLNGKNSGLKVIAVLVAPIALAVFVIGFVLNLGGGAGGMICEFLSGIVDGISSVFNGSTSAGKKKKIGNVEIQLAAVLDVYPWRSRMGDNWEKIQGAWGLWVPSGTVLDKVEVKWEISVWGWGLDRWNLGRRVNYVAGTVDRDVEGSSTNHVKRFETDISSTNQFWMGYGQDACKYGKDGGLTRVKIRVEARATLGGETKYLNVEKSVYGLSV